LDEQKWEGQEVPFAGDFDESGQTEDYWMRRRELPNMLIRRHVKPRRTLYVPENQDIAFMPIELDQLRKRTTIKRSSRDTEEEMATRTDNWQLAQEGKPDQTEWYGETRFNLAPASANYTDVWFSNTKGTTRLS
jgi:hypothetical protein